MAEQTPDTHVITPTSIDDPLAHLSVDEINDLAAEARDPMEGEAPPDPDDVEAQLQVTFAADATTAPAGSTQAASKPSMFDPIKELKDPGETAWMESGRPPYPIVPDDVVEEAKRQGLGWPEEVEQGVSLETVVRNIQIASGEPLPPKHFLQRFDGPPLPMPGDSAPMASASASTDASPADATAPSAVQAGPDGGSNISSTNLKTQQGPDATGQQTQTGKPANKQSDTNTRQAQGQQPPQPLPNGPTSLAGGLFGGVGAMLKGVGEGGGALLAGGGQLGGHALRAGTAATLNGVATGAQWGWHGAKQMRDHGRSKKTNALVSSIETAGDRVARAQRDLAGTAYMRMAQQRHALSQKPNLSHTDQAELAALDIGMRNEAKVNPEVRSSMRRINRAMREANRFSRDAHGYADRGEITRDMIKDRVNPALDKLKQSADELQPGMKDHKGRDLRASAKQAAERMAEAVKKMLQAIMSLFSRKGTAPVPT